MSSSGSFFDDLGEEAAGRNRPGFGVALWTVVGVVALVAAAYAALAWFAEDMAPRRASVEGVAIGGLSAQEAEATLRRELSPRLTDPVVLTHQGKKVSIVPEDAGISIDFAETLRRAGAGSAWQPMDLWRHYTGDSDTGVVLAVDEAAMSRELDGVTDTFDTLAVEGTLDFSTGRAVPVYGRPGLRVDREETIVVIQRAIFDPIDLELPVESRDPYISGPAVRAALADFGRPAMSAPVAILIGPARIVVPPKLVGQALTMIPGSGKLTPMLDGRRLLELLEPRMETVGDKARNASVRVLEGELQTVPARTGAAWDDAEFAQGVLQALVKPEGERRFRLQAALTEPKVTDEVVAKWGIVEQVESVTVELGEADAATRAAVQRLDNRRIPAGGEFSLLDTVTEEGLGRQTPVVAAALFRAAYLLGLEAQREDPEQRDDRVPLGFDVRLDRDHDLVLRNPTPHSVLVSVTIQGETLHVSLWSTQFLDTAVSTSPPRDVVEAGTREGPAEECRPRAARDGFSVSVSRQVTAPGATAQEDSFVTTYPAREGVTC